MGAVIWKQVPSNGVMQAELVEVHRAECPLNAGEGLANYCYNNPSKYRWHTSIGQDGTRWRHLRADQEGIHSAGLNHKAIGIECVGYSASSEWPEAMMDALALEIVERCEEAGLVPTRYTVVIGHIDDHLHGGTSTHTDPCCKMDWDDLMGRVWAIWKPEEEDDLPYTEAQLKNLFRQAANDLAPTKFVNGQMDRVQGDPRPTEEGPRQDGWDYADKLLPSE